MPKADFESAKKEVEKLVLKLKQVRESGRLRNYNEENTKKDFITPLFRALGWDMENLETPDEVTNEDRVSKGRVDYAFRLNTIPKFFLEAKALNKGIDEAKDAGQAINYSWHKGTTWAVLTDFQTLSIYNAEVKEKNLSDARFISLSCDQFVDQFQKLWWLSRQAFQEGLLDKEAVGWGKKLKKTKVGDQLLQELMGHRELLSKNILKNNSGRGLSEEDLDEAVQRIIDRLIFIRTAEDRQIEPPVLLPKLREFQEKGKGRITSALNEIYLQFDRAYNSKLFTFDPNDPSKRHLCETLGIDNDVLAQVINGLYKSRDGLTNYDFSAIDADVLGNIYEQYLSHILKKTEKRAKVESKEAHRKEQGIYYTPTYIVDYIVKNTLGEALKSRKPAEADKLKVLDMACGSGSFLLKAFDVLDEYYQKHEKGYAQARLDVESEAAKITRKTKILKNNIYGVDLDPKAVEIAQLNLLLKAAETKHRLPDLRENVKCGNSLIDQSLSEETRAFDWKKEFPEVMKEGGFDVIVGNPPYVRQEELTEIKPYLEANYEVYQGTADLFTYFFERELKMLKEGGYFGMIVSNKWLRAGYGKNLRKFLSQFWIEKFIDFGDLKVFPDATIYPCIIIIRRIKKPNPKIGICKIGTLEFGSLSEYVKSNSFFINQNELIADEWNIQSTEANKLIKKIKESGMRIEDYVRSRIYRGIVTGLNEAFIINNETKSYLIEQDYKSAEIIKPILSGSEIDRYGMDSKSKFVIFTRRGIDIERYPAIKKYLQKFEANLTPRKSKGDKVGRKPGDYRWYEIQDVSAYYQEFEKPKILWGNLTTNASFYYDEKNHYVNAPGCILPTSSKYVLGILNSKLMSYFLKSICAERQGGFIEQKPVYVSQVPIKKPTASQEEAISELADKMLQLNERLQKLAGKQTDERARLEREIAETDGRIDELVYGLYGLSAGERRIVEESVK